MFYLTLPDAGIHVFIPAILLLGLFIGCLTGLFGVGGGFLMTPCLNIVFGIDWKYAIGSGLTQFFCTGGMSAYKHWWRKNVDLKLGCLMGCGAAVGSLAGKRINIGLSAGAGEITLNGHVQSVYELVMSALFLVLMAAVMVSILRETGGEGKAAPEGAAGGEAVEVESEEVESAIGRWLQTIPIPPTLKFERAGIATMSLWVPLVVSFTVGVLTGLMGVGGGFVLLPLLVYVIGVPTTVAVGTSAFQILFAAAAGATGYFIDGEGRAALFGIPTGYVVVQLVATLLAGAFLGVQIGVHLSEKLGGKRIRKYFCLVVGLGAAVVVFKLIRSIGFGIG